MRRRAGDRLIWYLISLHLFLAALLFCQLGMAQTLTFTSQTVVGAEKVTPVLTWSTEPAASSCTASGASNWAGSKAASGTVTLDPITQSATYTLVCSWPGNIGASLSWQAPTTNTDGTPLAICPSDTSTGTCLLKFRLSYGRSPDQLSSVKDIGRNVRTWQLPELSGGTWYFSMKAVTAQGIESLPTDPPLSKTTGTASTQTRTVGIVVQPRPSQVPLTVQ